MLGKAKPVKQAFSTRLLKRLLYLVATYAMGVMIVTTTEAVRIDIMSELIIASGFNAVSSP